VADKCPAIIKLCAVRVTLLDSTGAPVDAADNSYVSDKTVTLGFTPVVSEGQDREVRNGCDCIVASDKAPDLLKRFTFEIAQGVLEPALLAMLLGQTLITNDEDEVIGINWLTPATCVTSTTNVALEGWAQAYDSDHQDADLPWLHLLWPSTTWQLAPNTLSADFLQPALTGFSRGNTEFGDPYDDFPADGTGLLSSDFFSMWLTAEDPPTAECGAQSLVIA
jgi:hypothetical protein